MDSSLFDIGIRHDDVGRGIRGRVVAAHMTRTLIGLILESGFKTKCISRAYGDTGGTIITFLTELILHGLKTELTNTVTTIAVVALADTALDTQYTIAAKE